MSLAEYFTKQCTDKLKENIAYALAKLNDPSSLVKVEASGALVDAASGGMGGLADFAQDYLTQNAGGLALAAAGALGVQNTALDAYNLFLSTMAQAMAAYNDLLLLFLKEQAKNIQDLLNKKIAINQDIKIKLVQLVNTMTAMDSGDPVFEAYLKKLRAALVQLNSGRQDIKSVRNNLAATNNFLPKVYRRGRNNVRDAAQKIKPPTDSEKIIIPAVAQSSFDFLSAAQSDPNGAVFRIEPNVFYYGTSGNSNEFSVVNAGDILTILSTTNNAHVQSGTYTVVQRLSGRAIKVDKNIFNTAIQDNVNDVGNIPFYIKTIVKGVGAAITSAVVKNIGIPTEPQQIENMLAIPKLIQQTILSSKDYISTTLAINARLVLYYSGLQQLLDGMPDVMKKYVLGLFDNVLGKLNTLVSDMSVNLNGDKSYINSVKGGFHADPLNVSTHAFKWAMDINLIVETMKTIPASVEVVHKRGDGRIQASNQRDLYFGDISDGTQFSKVKPGDVVVMLGGDQIIPGDYTVIQKFGVNVLRLDKTPLASSLPSGSAVTNVTFTVETDGPLGEYQLAQEVVNVYKNTVIQLKKLGDASNGSAVLKATEGQESPAVFEAQLLVFLLEAGASVVSSSARTQLISLGETLIARCDLAIARDTLEKKILQQFIDTPIPLEDTLKTLLKGLTAILAGTGLDKAADLLASGDYAKLFNLNSQNATYIGAALEAIALLKSCFQDDASKAQLDAAQNDLQGQKDLFNIKLSFDFDLAILKNLQDCLDLTNLAKLFASKEFICNAIAKTAAQAQILGGQAMSSLQDLVTAPGESSGESASGFLTDSSGVGLASQTA